MMVLVTIIHVLACLILVPVVLLQAGKGADMGAVFGGASSTIFGSSGAGNFLTRLTTGAAIVFMITSLTLTYGGTRQTSSTIMPDAAVAPAGASAPAGGDADTVTADVDGGQPAPETDQAAAGNAASGEGAPAAAAPVQKPAQPAAP